MTDDLDPSGLIAEAYRIEGITPEECRSIFLDWSLGHRERRIGRDEVALLLDRHGGAHPDHPMTQVLREGMTAITAPLGRRGGSRGRR